MGDGQLQRERLEALGLEVVHDAHGERLGFEPPLRERDVQREQGAEVRHRGRRAPLHDGHLHVDLCNRQVNGQFDHQHIAFKGHDLGHAEAQSGGRIGVDAAGVGRVVPEVVVGVFGVILPLELDHIPVIGTHGDVRIAHQGVVQHRHVVDRPSLSGVDAHFPQHVHFHPVALEGGRVVAIEQGHVVNEVRQLEQERRGQGVDNGEHLTRAEGATELHLVGRHRAAVVVGLDGIFPEVCGGGGTGVVDLEALVPASAIEVFGEEEVDTQAAGVARQDGHVQRLAGEQATRIRGDAQDGQADTERGGVNGAEMTEAMHRVLAQPKRLEVVLGCARGVEDVAVRVGDHEQVVCLGALGGVSEMEESVGEAKAPNGLVVPGCGQDRPPIATRRQAVKAVDLHGKGAERDAPGSGNAVIRSAHGNRFRLEVPVIAHAPDEAGAGRRSGKIIAEVAFSTRHHINHLAIEVGDDQAVLAFDGIGRGEEGKKAAREVHTHLRHASVGPLSRDQAAVAIEHIGRARGRLLEHHLVGPEGRASVRKPGPGQGPPVVHAEHPLVKLGLARGQGVDQKRVGLVRGAIHHGIEQPIGRQQGAKRKIRTVPLKQGDRIAPVAKEARLEFDVGSPHLRVGQQEEACTVGLESIQIKGRVSRRREHTAPTLVEHHDVAVQWLIRCPEELDELQAVRHRVAVGVHLVEEHLLGGSARGSEDEKSQKGEDPVGEVL